MSLFNMILLIVVASIIITALVIYYLKREFLDYRFSLAELTTTICLSDIQEEIQKEDAKKEISNKSVESQIAPIVSVGVQKDEKEKQVAVVPKEQAMKFVFENNYDVPMIIQSRILDEFTEDMFCEEII